MDSHLLRAMVRKPSTAVYRLHFASADYKVGLIFICVWYLLTNITIFCSSLFLYIFKHIAFCCRRRSRISVFQYCWCFIHLFIHSHFHFHVFNFSFIFPLSHFFKNISLRPVRGGSPCEPLCIQNTCRRTNLRYNHHHCHSHHNHHYHHHQTKLP